MSQSALMTMKRTDVPNYLHLSELYLSFDTAESDDEFSVPSDCIKRDLYIQSAGDLESLFLTMRYWILERFPNEVISFLTENYSSELKSVFEKFESTFSSVLELLEAIKSAESNEYLKLACKYGRIDFIDFFVDQGAPITTSHLMHSSNNGHVGCLRQMYQLLASHGPVEIPESYLFAAVQHGQLSCLQFYIQDCNVSWHRELVNCAAEHLQLTCLQYLVDHFQKQGETVRSDTWEFVLRNGEAGMHCLEYLLKSVSVPPNQFNLMAMACRAGNTHAMKRLFTEGYEVTCDLITVAAQAGYLECLQYLHIDHNLNFLKPSTLAAATEAGQLALVKQLCNMGCPVDVSVFIMAKLHRRESCLQYLLKRYGMPKSAAFKATPTDVACRLTILEYKAGLQKSWKYDFY